ncbi:hypothetical protein BGX23_007884 [Mortierella sp. AD031]|nr:hypothetical protein BGX23_007884 [Mortierella sp. AD031]
MSVPLSRRRKAELKELASSLGLSGDGVREDLVERIKAHIATSNDPSLRALIRDDSPDGTTYTNPSSVATSGRSSPRKKTTTVITKETRTSSSSNGYRSGSGAGARRGSHSPSHTEDELEEREVRGFMEHMQGELHDAKDLAKQLEETLHAKTTTGSGGSNHDKSTVTTTTTTKTSGSGVGGGGRRGSKDHHDSGHSSSHHKSRHSSSHRHDDSDNHLLRSHRLHRGDGDDDDDEEHRHHHKHKHGRHGHRGHGVHVWGSRIVGIVKHHLGNVRHYTDKPWRYLQDSTSGSSCVGFLTNWPNFLQPFFSYYGTFFLLPTLLSQLFNVDRAASSSSSKPSLTGLLSKRTTSGLSYFVFKFALTYFLGHSIGFRSLLGTALPAGAKIWSGCKYISDIFRYVPQSLGLATSGAGTVLALAESIVQSHNNHRR